MSCGGRADAPFWVYCTVASQIVSLALFLHCQRCAALFGPSTPHANVACGQVTFAGEFRRFCASVSRWCLTPNGLIGLSACAQLLQNTLQASICPSSHSSSQRLSSTQARSRSRGGRPHHMSFLTAGCGTQRNTLHRLGLGKWRTYSGAATTSPKIHTQCGVALSNSQEALVEIRSRE